MGVITFTKFNSFATVSEKEDYLKSVSLLDQFDTDVLSWFDVYKFFPSSTMTGDKTKLTIERTLQGGGTIINVPDNETEFNRIVNNAINIANEVLVSVINDFDQSFKASEIINSWYRRKEVNEDAGGSDTSDHINAEAIDFQYLDKPKNADIFYFLINNVRYHQLIWEVFNTNSTTGRDFPELVHIGFRKNKQNDFNAFSFPDLNLKKFSLNSNRGIGFTNQRDITNFYEFNVTDTDVDFRSLLYDIIKNNSIYFNSDVFETYLQGVYTYIDNRFKNKFGFDYVNTRFDDKIVECGVCGFNRDFIGLFFNQLGKKRYLDLYNDIFVNNTLTEDEIKTFRNDKVELNNLARSIVNGSIDKGFVTQLVILIVIADDVFNKFITLELEEVFCFSLMLETYLDLGVNDIENISFFRSKSELNDIQNDGGWLDYYVNFENEQINQNIVRTYNQIIQDYFE